MRFLLLTTMFATLLNADIVLNLCSSKKAENLQNCYKKAQELIKNNNLKDYKSLIQKSKDYNVLRIWGIKNTKEYTKIKKIFIKQFPDLYSYEMESSNKTIVKKKISPKKDSKLLSKINRNDYNKAARLFKEKKYEEAYNLFEELFNQDLSNALVNFYLARSAYEIKNYDEALNAYERVLINYPNHTRAKLERARTLFMLKLYDDAKKEFREILLSKKLPEKVKVNINKFLNAISSLEQKHYFNTILIASLGFDDNSNSGVDSDVINLTSALVGTNTNKPLSDSFHQEILVFSHVYDIGERGDDFIKQDIIALNKIMTKYSEKNVFYLSYSPKYTNTYKSYSYEAGVNYDTLWYGSEKLQNIFGFTIKSGKAISKIENANAYFKYSNTKNSKSTDRTKDNYSYELGADYTKIVSQTFNHGLKYFYNKTIGKDAGKSLDIYKSTHSIAYNLAKKFKKDYTFKYILNYKKTSYDYANTYGTKRDDNIYAQTFSIAKPINKTSLIDLKLQRTDTLSNQDTYDTDKTVYTINYTKSF